MQLINPTYPWKTWAKQIKNNCRKVSSFTPWQRTKILSTGSKSSKNYFFGFLLTLNFQKVWAEFIDFIFLKSAWWTVWTVWAQDLKELYFLYILYIICILWNMQLFFQGTPLDGCLCNGTSVIKKFRSSSSKLGFCCDEA